MPDREAPHSTGPPVQLGLTAGSSSIIATEPFAKLASLRIESSNPISASGGSIPRQTEEESWLKRKVMQLLFLRSKTVIGGNAVVQQTLPNVFTYVPPYIIIPILFLFMVLFVVFGACIIVESERRYLVHATYSEVHRYQYIPTDPAVNINQGIRRFDVDGVQHAQGTMTWVAFNISRTMKAPVYLYYTIDNMFQNYRRFHNGFSASQMAGSTGNRNLAVCEPYRIPGTRESDKAPPITIVKDGNEIQVPLSSFTYSPCGTTPWTLFNDTFTLFKVEDPTGDDIIFGGENGNTSLRLICNGTDFDAVGNPLGASVAPNHCAKKGISWRADTEVRFQNLTLSDYTWSLYYPLPTSNPYLRNSWYLNEPGHSLPDPRNLDLHVWMRSGVRRNFRKLYRIIADVDLEPGEYLMQIEEFYDTVSFRGKKGFLLRTTSWVGDDNVPMGITFVVMGCLCFVQGVAFFVELCLHRRGLNRTSKLPEPKRSWYNFDPASKEMKEYYHRRLERYIPVAELQLLRQKKSGEDVVNAS